MIRRFKVLLFLETIKHCIDIIDGSNHYKDCQGNLVFAVHFKLRGCTYISYKSGHAMVAMYQLLPSIISIARHTQI